jgi:hypothetical protein
VMRYHMNTSCQLAYLLSFNLMMGKRKFCLVVLVCIKESKKGPWLGTLHSDRGAMVDLSYESGPKSEAGLGRHCCSDAENGDSPRMFASIMQMIGRPILMITWTNERLNYVIAKFPGFFRRLQPRWVDVYFYVVKNRLKVLLILRVELFYFTQRFICISTLKWYSCYLCGPACKNARARYK